MNNGVRILVISPEMVMKGILVQFDHLLDMLYFINML